MDVTFYISVLHLSFIFASWSCFWTLTFLWHSLSKLIKTLHSSVCKCGDKSGCMFQRWWRTAEPPNLRPHRRQASSRWQRLLHSPQLTLLGSASPRCSHRLSHIYREMVDFYNIQFCFISQCIFIHLHILPNTNILHLLKLFFHFWAYLRKC